MKKLALLILLFYSISSIANTGRYRIIITDDPSSTIMIGWEQESGNNAIVYYDTIDYGTSWASYANSKTVDVSVTDSGMDNTFAKLSGLLPNTNYYFVINDSQGTSSRFWFRTAPNTNDTMSFISGGDSRNNSTPRQNANKMVAKLKPTAVFFGGDMTNGDSSSEWQDWFDDWQFTIATDGRMFPIIPARGNHESNNSRITNLFNTPSTDIYYKITFGSNLYSIYTLNSEISAGGTQFTWLQNELINDNAIWKSAQYHKPMRPHVSSKSEGNDEYSNWSQLFFDNTVNLVYESDSHSVKSTWPIKPCSSGVNCDEGFERDDVNGTVYVGEGCWGAPLRTADDNKIWSRDFGSFNQFKWVCVSASLIEVKTIAVDNADSVAENGNNSVCDLPSGINVWNPSNGDTISIVNSALQSPQIAITSLTNNQYISDGNNVLVNTNATDADGTITFVEFYIDGALINTDNSSPFQITYTFTDGEHAIETIAYDNDNLTNSESITLYVGNYSDTITNTVDNDVEQQVDDTIESGSSDLELVYDTSYGNSYQQIGLRFTNINIPKNAQITSAYVQFKAKSTHNTTVTLDVSVENTLNSQDYANGTVYNVTGSSRSYFTAVNWDVLSWTANDANTAQRTPSLVTSIQALVNNQSWTPGNALSIKIEGTGVTLTGSGTNKRRAYSLNNGDTSTHPVLHINYTMNSSTLSTSDFTEDDIEIYPNPFKDVVYLNLPETYKNATINVYDIKGKLIHTGSLNNNQIDLHTLSNGIYLIEVINKNNNNVVTKKVVKK